MANMDFSKICFNCMGELRAAGERCPHCGYDNRRRSNDTGFLASSVLNNQYFVGRALGRGGFGITYLGYDMNLKRRVAIKEYFPRELAARANNSITLTPYTDSRRSFEYGMRRALDEGVIIANMGRVPNVVQVYNAFRANGTAYVIMEYIDGRTLSSIVQRRGRLPWRYAWELLRPVEKALEQIHAKGVIHRDVSPDNIMLPNGSNETMLLDFGAAHPYVDINEGHTRSLRPGFAPAEQYSSKSLQDGRTDEYALCATYYYLVTGVIPVGADQIAAGVEKLAAPRDLGTEIPKQVEDVLLKGMSVNMVDRYATIKDLGAAFEAALAACPEQGQKETAQRQEERKDEPNNLKPRASSDRKEHPKPNPMNRALIALVCAIVVLTVALAVVLLKPGPEPEPAQETIQEGPESPMATEPETQTPDPDSTATQGPSEEPQPEPVELSEAEVRELQAKLIALNLLPAGSDSGNLDQATEEALKRFQVHLNEWQGDELVTPNGEPDALTLTWLDFYYEEKQKETPTPSPEPTPSPTPTPTPSPTPTPTPTPEPTEVPCVFTEPAIEEAVRGWLGKATGDIHLAELKEITKLDLSNKDISGIDDLSDLTNLRWLYLNDNNIRDISVLSGLTQLTHLDLSNNSISDISALSGLTNLSNLHLSGNQISDVSALSGLTNLGTLYLSDNPIGDLSMLEGLNAEIFCSYVFTEPVIEAAVREWLEKPTGNIYSAELKEITKLDLSNEGISDIGDLSNLTNLRWLYLNDNNIRDISALSGLTQLTHLDLGNNDIRDISALRGLTNLIGLRLSGNQISDFRALRGLTNLGTLYLNGNPISDRSLLEGLDAAMIIYETTPTPKPTNTPTPKPTNTPTPKPTATPKPKAVLGNFDPYGEGTSPMLNGPYRRDQIATITFRDTQSGAPSDAWDVSLNKDGSVLAWATRNREKHDFPYYYFFDNGVPNELYDLVIAGDGKVYAPIDCEGLFQDCDALWQIRFNGCFDTSGVRNMSAMFGFDHHLESVDLQDFDTSNVTDMSYMFDFDCCLTDLDLRSFDTSRVQSMEHMFYSCEALSSIRTGSGFIVGEHTDTTEMLEDCPVWSIGSFTYATPTPRPTKTPTPRPTKTPTPKPTKTPTPKPTPPPPDYNYDDAEFDQKRGDKGDTVKKIQQRLIELGYLNDSADGSYGAKTQAAVEAFQRNNGIHGPNAYGAATELTQAVLFSDEALASYQAPRLSSWSVSSDPYSVKVGNYIAEENGDTVLHFRIQNYNSTQPIVAMVVRYCLVDSNNTLIDYNGTDCYQNKHWSLRIRPGEILDYTVKLADSPNLKKADHLWWTVTELAYGNGEVYIDYDTSIQNDYDYAGYSTDF